jgi:hypothetical protein
MGKIIAICLMAVLTGCATKPELVKPVCADKAIYKKYDITMPTRPVLGIKNLNDTSTLGTVARTYEIDLLNMMEYSVQLENIIIPLTTDTTIVQEITITPSK